MKEILLKDGTIDTLTNVAIVSKIVKDLGIKLDGKYQK